MKTIGIIALTIACLFMAGLNLWNEFKDWFDKKYQRKEQGKPDNQSMDIRKDETKNIPDIIGKSKFNLKEEELKQKQRQAEQTRKITVDVEENNIPIHSIDLEKEENPLSGYTGPISSEDEIILDTQYDKTDIVQSKDQSFTMDEFELLAKTLQGKPMPEKEEKQIPEILQRVHGTNLYEQFISQVNGAEAIAGNILRLAEIDSEMDNNNNSSNTGNLSKFIRT
ncbi:hypothetical protein M2451_002686 [Dysgonomonas sp. PFB1-18]|uniref:hypothetical protein n=1 Tax=unclassified Dysgonomonas TaxID=2630389 RepID=UPI0024768092|nr:MULTISPECIES: hypothetical protein [unclassified Dysgonomonas]MDH6309428.1 hypothetical protein [Dysgonomonas sp. PF1-14]MDH6339707.1 hypothetical protein [Dysgonomonas sp. PF1-16]MDH6381355.1 hypothetical protein [Dysgonomonas sp. PFB1-18]MDH6398570.1 hypothetical protein [Dysgonomonas sp. PF1-23]